MSNVEQQKTKFRTQAGFIAALDQSGGSTLAPPWYISAALAVSLLALTQLRAQAPESAVAAAAARR